MYACDPDLQRKYGGQESESDKANVFVTVLTRRLYSCSALLFMCYMSLWMRKYTQTH